MMGIVNAVCALVVLIVTVYCQKVLNNSGKDLQKLQYTARYLWRSRNIYLTKEDVINSLDNIRHRKQPEVAKLFSTYNFYYTLKKKRKYLPVTLENVTHRMPFIVIEGSEASGSHYIARKVSMRINGKFFPNPPECFSHLLEPFKHGLSKLRAAFKAFCNYAVAEEIAETIQNQPAVVDGYHYRHQAYHLARYAVQHNNGKLPNSHLVYKWPKDLLKPDIVYWIKTSEEAVIKRLNLTNIHRYTNATVNMVIAEAYTRFNDTPIQRIDGDGLPPEIIERILDHITLMFASK